MKKFKLLCGAMALALVGQAQAAGVNYTDVQVDNLQPKAGFPVTLNFAGLTSACGANVSTNIPGFQMSNGSTVQDGKLSFVPQSVYGTPIDSFVLTVQPGNYGQGCQGPAKTFDIQVNNHRVGVVNSEIGMVTQGKPVNVLVHGMPGVSCDGAALDFGDGTPVQQISGVFPIKTSHVYSQPGNYFQKVKANGATCWGEAISDMNTKVIAEAALNNITGLQVAYVNPQKTAARITVNGYPDGSCERAFVNWGDGLSPEPISGKLPLVASHQYQNGGTQNIAVKAADGFKCQGQLQTSVYVYPAQAKFSGITPPASTAQVNQDVTVELSGSGICEQVSVALGDNLNIVSLGAVNFSPYNNFKWPVKLKYAKGGSYTLSAKDSGASNCGTLVAKVTVGEPLQFNPIVVMPAAGARPVVALPAVTPAAPATPPKPKPAGAAKPCVKKNGVQVDPNCVDA